MARLLITMGYYTVFRSTAQNVMGADSRFIIHIIDVHIMGDGGDTILGGHVLIKEDAVFVQRICVIGNFIAGQRGSGAICQ